MINMQAAPYKPIDLGLSLRKVDAAIPRREASFTPLARRNLAFSEGASSLSVVSTKRHAHLDIDACGGARLGRAGSWGRALKLERHVVATTGKKDDPPFFKWTDTNG
jgi:hypothetical protein